MEIASNFLQDLYFLHRFEQDRTDLSFKEGERIFFESKLFFVFVFVFA